MVAAFDVPLRQTLYVSLIDDRSVLPNAIALNSFIVNAARVIGPALAGALLALATEALVGFAPNAISFVRARPRLRSATRRRPRPRRAVAASATTGTKARATLLGFAPIRLVLVVIAVAAWTISPYLVADADLRQGHLRRRPADAGLAAVGGGRAGAPALDRLPRRARHHRRAGRVVALATVTAGLALAAFAFLRVFAVGVLLMTLVGGGVILAAASTNTVLQTIVEDRLRGRVLGLFTMAFLAWRPSAISLPGRWRGNLAHLRRSRSTASSAPPLACGSGRACRRSPRRCSRPTSGWDSSPTSDGPGAAPPARVHWRALRRAALRACAARGFGLKQCPSHGRKTGPAPR